MPFSITFKAFIVRNTEELSYTLAPALFACIEDTTELTNEMVPSWTSFLLCDLAAVDVLS